MTTPYFFDASIQIEGKMNGTPEQIREYLKIKLNNLATEIQETLPNSDDIRATASPGQYTVFRKITSDGYQM